MECKIKRINKHSLFKYLPEQIQQELKNITHAIMDVPRGMMMLDDISDTVKKALEEMNVHNKEAQREKFIKLILSAPLNDYISSLTFPEYAIPMLNTRSCRKIVDSLTRQCYVLGFRASQGQEQLFKPGDEITVGIDHLARRCTEYKKYGFKYAVWRNIIKIGDDIPSKQSVIINAKNNARFAVICQSQGLVPVVEFEISNEGTHTIEEGRRTLEKLLSATFRSFGEEQVYIEGLIIQCSSVKSGINSEIKNTPEQIAEATVAAFSRTILTAIKGIQIITGSLFEEEVESILNALFHFRTRKKPWLMTFTVGRNLQTLALNTWKGKLGNAKLVRENLRNRAEEIMNACSGKYKNNQN